MKKFHYYLFPVLIYILSLLPGTLHSQSAFVQLPDATGYAQNTTHLVYDSLKSASTALRRALPSAYQADFAVYDLGFYSHHTSMDGGIPQVITDAIADRVSTSYYLLFGREMDREGRLKRVWVEVELPHTADFCFWEDGSLSHLKFMTESRANSVKGLSMSKQGAIFDAMIDGIKYMGGRVAQLVECCSSSAREVCECGWSFEDIREFTAMRGFYELQADVVPSVSLDTVCVCFNEFQVNEEIHELDSGKVIVATTLDEIMFSDSISTSIEDLREILLGFGDAANSLNLSFFGAVTDQNIFCNWEGDPNTLRSGNNINHLEFENELYSSNIGLWFNVLHYNGNATVSILAKGIDENLIKLAFSADCLNTSEWHLCAFNHINFGYVPHFSRPPGIVINGANNSKITIRNRIIRQNFYLFQTDFGGQYEIDLSQVAIGYEFKTGGSLAAAYGNKTQFCLVRTLFLGGDYYGYWYNYIGYEYNYILTTSFQAVNTYGKSYFIAINDDEESFEETYTPEVFAGPFVAFGGSASFKKIIAGINLDFQYIYSTPDPFWKSWSLGISGQSGSQQGFFKGVSVEGGGGFGELDLITPQIPTSQRTLRDKARNWFINTFW